ncbi:hypothetical protein [Desulfosarcina ovata]|uniref:Uncharacterized protein n=1 Tax=Desulfosarcina ovata subsp. ovata TaxID=2752305 RepID=A0A5K8AJ93_9BACT|nr:hypothetical protein [Desulfosarcina ovata]BBO92658.1 hypothetical protein DSCOOX_58380 [Desulfosarcina ovata subsp. ovata]
MIVNPAIVALIGGSLLTVGFAVYAYAWGIRIVRHWDLASGSEEQLGLERRTHLISTIMAYLLSFEIFSLFLFVYTADYLHPMFVGAMCAAGSLHVNDYGYPTLVVKIASVLVCGVWLIVNRCDSQAEDYPLIRFKYRLLVVVTVLVITAALLQFGYFKGLKAHVITSCCGVLFSSDARSVAGTVAALPPSAMRVVFFACLALQVRLCIHLLVTGRGGRLLGWISLTGFVVAILSVIAWISPYYYELPTHHCPFDLLQAYYGYVGYPLYLGIFGTAIFGMGIGVLDRFRKIRSLAAIVPVLQRRYAWLSLGASLLTIAIAVYPMLFSDFRLG